MGDVAMAVPVVSSLARQHDVQITVVSRPFLKPLFDDIPNVNFFAADLDGRHKGIFGLLRLYSDLRKLGITSVADFHNVIRSKVITNLFALSGRRTASIDKGRKEKKALTRLHNKVFKQLTPTADRYKNVLSHIGFDVNDDIYEFPPKPELSAALHDFAGAKSGKWVGIAPFAQHRLKMYPEDLMSEVIEKLSAKADVRYFLFGSRSEKPILDKYASGHPNVKVVAGNFDFRQELNLIRNLDLMLSMDSGNAHLAAIYGIKTITLWGATHPFTGFAPYKQPFGNAITSYREKFPALPTSIYGNKNVPGYEDAMRTILPETVVAKVLSEL